ncbi:predicted protein [Naegleria gruberi]|uniref:Predicted protein n=1 Tax=Naegleria gruberi TaxID=5762 RepID=D2VGH7_NAEGR|nr:uncharacterized protein NAEGRDRAFT_67983 [Naegleria gruberi]EFC43967.1 predicted protein [Naegleria gruberi]|eukprot:XP_002676711.1 predicted protein [Naegleria gruberi strain NEG-M]
MALVLVNIIGHIQGIIEILPGAPLFFQSYWNQFISEKLTKQVDAQTFYRNNLNSYGVPTWLESFALFENIYCFIDAYFIYGCTVIGLAMYSIQIIKLMLLLLLKDRKQAVARSLEEFKKRQVEKFKDLKLKEVSSETNLQDQKPISLMKRLSRKILFVETNTSSENLTKQSGESSPTTSASSVSSAPSTSNLLESNNSQQSQQQLQQESSEVSTPRLSKTGENDDSSSLAYEDIALDLTTDEDALSTSYEEISKKGKFVNFLKKILKYQIIELSYIGFWLTVWYILVTIVIIIRTEDTWSNFFISWDSYSGYCRHNDRVQIGYYSIAILFLIFVFIPITLIFDFVTSLIKYRKIIRINREKNRKTENFLIYYFYETDPFVYRTEVLGVLILDFIVVLTFLIVLPIGVNANYSQQLASSILLSIGLNFIGGVLCNPGITISRTVWNYLVEFKTKRANKKDSNDSDTIFSLQQLISSPICSESIDYVLSHKTERGLFYQYLKEEYSVENLLFTEDLIKLRKIHNAHIRAKVMKIKEMIKLYLSNSDSVFELNVPTKVIQQELTNFRELMALLDELNLKATQLPRVFKADSNTRYFPNIDSNKEEKLKQLISQLGSGRIFTNIQSEVYKNLMDSYYRFNNSRKWKDYIKTSSSSA